MPLRESKGSVLADHRKMVFIGVFHPGSWIIPGDSSTPAHCVVFQAYSANAPGAPTAGGGRKRQCGQPTHTPDRKVVAPVPPSLRHTHRTNTACLPGRHPLVAQRRCAADRFPAVGVLFFFSQKITLLTWCVALVVLSFSLCGCPRAVLVRVVQVASTLPIEGPANNRQGRTGVGGGAGSVRGKDSFALAKLW